MNKIKTWILNNKLSSVLILIISLFILNNLLTFASNTTIVGTTKKTYDVNNLQESVSYEYARSGTTIPATGGAAPTLDVTDRMVITNSHMSLLVKSVEEAMDTIKTLTTNMGGFMVNSSITSPEGLTNGTITIRVPADKLDSMLEELKGLAVKVVSENVNGTDVTDSYVDLEERLATYETTKTKYEAILNSATEVEDILQVTERIIYVQSQIDNIKGQMQYLEKTSESSLVTIYLSTDELELPYAPDQSWRPSVVFKYAVRSLITNGRKVANLGIWLAVYSPIVLVGWGIAKVVKTKKKGKKTK